jgi:hypothetical protein
MPGDRVSLNTGTAQITTFTTLNNAPDHSASNLNTFINAELDKFNQCLDLETQRA